VRGLREKRTKSGEKIRRGAPTSCRKRGAAITQAMRRKAGRAGQAEGVPRERSRLIRCRTPHTNRRGDADGLAAVEGGLMAGTITARTLDYFGLLVAASIVALCSAGVTAICIRFEERALAWFWAASFFGSALVGAYCLWKLL
jgi:hypothetical protein